MIEATKEIKVGDTESLYSMGIGETARIGSWYVTKVASGWIYTLKNLPVAMGYSVADYHSIFVPHD